MEVVLANAQKEFPELEQIEPLNSNEKEQWNWNVYVRKNYVLCQRKWNGICFDWKMVINWNK